MAEEKKIDNKTMNDKEDTKSADNKIDTKTKLRLVNDRIDVERQKMKNLDELEELFVSLNRNINKCVELLGRSIKGENIGRKLSAIEENNKVSFNKSIYNINSDREEVKNLLSRLNDERDEYQEMIRRENQIELEHELEKEEKKEDKKEEEKE